jgi:hypothetical protein
MKYYCQGCGSVFDPGGDRAKKYAENHRAVECIACREYMTPFPDYETPDQWKDRTGKDLSDEAQVWWRIAYRGHSFSMWKMAAYNHLHKSVPLITPNYTKQIIIGGPEPPPDDWGADCPYSEYYDDNTYKCSFAGHMGFVHVGDTCVSPIEIISDRSNQHVNYIRTQV